jgi:hypothetical protein
MRTNDARQIKRALFGSLLAGFALHCGSGGIGGSGGVSGFGSVFVNGIEWFTESAEITLDGVPGTEGDLRIGMIVDLDGDPLSATTATASTVRFDDDIQGGVDAIVQSNSTTKQVAVFGQTVVLRDGSTVFDDSDPSFGFDSVALDDVLEVSGHRDGAGTIEATWVRRLGVVAFGSTAVEVEGVVAALVPGTSFILGSVGVLTDPGTDLSGLEDDLENGAAVEVEGVLLAAGLIYAQSVSDLDQPPTEIERFSLEGLVSDFVSISDFRVAGQRVNAGKATFTPADPSFLADGVLVDVEGPILGGVLAAHEVELEAPEVSVEAELVSAGDVNPSAGTVILLGIEVQLEAGADLSDDRDGLPAFGLGDLAAGDFLVVEGHKDLGGVVVAKSLVRQGAGDVLVRGAVTAFDAAAREVEICGVVVPVDGSTELADAAGDFPSEAAFFAALELGLEATAKDLEDGDETAIDVADSVELGD